MYEIDHVHRLNLGMQGEAHATVIEIDMTAWAERWPDASYSVLFSLPGRDTFYVPTVTASAENVLTWTVGAYETSDAGVGLAEIRAMDAATGLIKKSKTIPTWVYETPSFGDRDESDPPDALKTWANRLINAEGSVQNAIRDAQNAADSIVNMANDLVRREELTVTEDEDGWVAITGGSGPRTPYPVGSYYICENEANPAALYGGRWQEVTGRMLIGRSASRDVGNQGGSETFSLTTNNVPSGLMDAIDSIMLRLQALEGVDAMMLEGGE